MQIPNVKFEKENSITVELKTEQVKKKKSYLCLENIMIVIITLITASLLAALGLKIIYPDRYKYETLEVKKLKKVNRVVLDDTLSLDKGTPLYQLQNKIHDDLLKDNEKINFNIANQDLLSLDLITSEFSGAKHIRIGDKSSIDIRTNDKRSIINYNQFSEEGKNAIMKELDKKNSPKIDMRITTKQNTDGTYSIMTVINK